MSDHWLDNSIAIKLSRSIAVLERLRAEDDRDFDERIAIAYAEGHIESQRDEARLEVAKACAAWFDSSAFDISRAVEPGETSPSGDTRGQ